MMRVLGIDPGSRITGFGVISVHGNALLYVASGCVRMPAQELPLRLKLIYDGLGQIIRTHRPDMVAVEKVFMARNAQSALTLGQARGAAITACVGAGLPVAEYSALQIKQAVVGKGKAGKEQVQHMVTILLGLEGTPRKDAADALACAICHVHTHQGNRRLRQYRPAKGPAE